MNQEQYVKIMDLGILSKLKIAKKLNMISLINTSNMKYENRQIKSEKLAEIEALLQDYIGKCKSYLKDEINLKTLLEEVPIFKSWFRPGLEQKEFNFFMKYNYFPNEKNKKYKEIVEGIIKQITNILNEE